jgi:hypothetical protein
MPWETGRSVWGDPDLHHRRLHFDNMDDGEIYSQVLLYQEDQAIG